MSALAFGLCFQALFLIHYFLSKVAGDAESAFDLVTLGLPVAAHDDLVVFDLGQPVLCLNVFDQTLW